MPFVHCTPRTHSRVTNDRISMIEFFGDFFQWMGNLSPLWMYVIILAITYLENVVPPIPGDMVVVFGGYLVAAGSLNFVAVVILSTIGGVVGFMSVYAIGFSMGRVILAPDRLTWLPKKRIYRVQDWMEQYGYGIVAANRFLSGARSVISLTVGMAQMAPGSVALYAALSALLWTGLLTSLGYLVGDNWRVIGAYLSQYGWLVLALIGTFILYRLGRYLWQRKKSSAEDTSRVESLEEPD